MPAEATDPTDGSTLAPAHDDGGRGEFGDGVDSPLYEFRASRFRGGRLLTPNVWAEITVESSGGHVITLSGVPKSEAERVKSLLDDAVHWEVHRAVHRAKSPAAAPAPPQPTSVQADVASQLRALVKLRDDGILTDDEFAAQKSKILSA